VLLIARLRGCWLWWVFWIPDQEYRSQEPESIGETRRKGNLFRPINEIRLNCR